MIGHQLPRLDPTLLLLSQPPRSPDGSS
jgi:hypothetical protein